MAKVAVESSADPAVQSDTVASKENDAGVCLLCVMFECVNILFHYRASWNSRFLVDSIAKC